jgi:hypothetical protein
MLYRVAEALGSASIDKAKRLEDGGDRHQPADPFAALLLAHRVATEAGFLIGTLRFELSDTRVRGVGRLQSGDPGVKLGELLGKGATWTGYGHDFLPPALRISLFAATT